MRNAGIADTLYEQVQMKKSGQCHRYAPKPSPRPKMQIEGRDLWADIQWPNVDINAWCGEFQQK